MANKIKFSEHFQKLKPFNFLALVIAGVINATGVVLLLAPSGILDSGFSGTAIFLSQITVLPLWSYILILNIPFFIFGFKKLGLPFIVYSIVAICSYSLMSFLYESVFQINQLIYNIINKSDGYMILCAVFGGLISGIGSGLTIRFGGAIDGVEVMAVIFAKRLNISVGQFVMAYNIVLYAVAAIVCQELAVALYSVITYAVGLKAVDFVVEGFDKGKACYIITDKQKQMAQEISENLGRGITLMDTKGYHSGQNKVMIYCVVNRFEVSKLKKIIYFVDPSAFVSIYEVSEVFGSGNVSLRSRSKQKADLLRAKKLSESKNNLKTASNQQVDEENFENIDDEVATTLDLKD